MKKSSAFIGFVLVALFILLPCCKHRNQKADIPDIGNMYSDISYLDTLIRSAQIDSIGKINDRITAITTAYTNRAQTPEDKLILDSLARINAVAHDFLQYCVSTQTNLDLLEQDTKALENQYRSGKIKITPYVSALLEEEQILIDLSNQLSDKNQLALQYLKNQSLLINRLSSLPISGN